jgi:pimeloyl-ACP methyl ester carboxylesterase
MKNSFKETIHIPVGEKELAGELVIPEKCNSLVLFSHGSGSSRLSPRNNYVAKVLQEEGIGTFLFDLLTPEEDNDYETRFNIELLTERLINATRFVSEFEWMKPYRMGYFGASTGAASALRAAAILPDLIGAVVSRGGRPDLAQDHLADVHAPTLFIVGGLDTQVISLNRGAYEQLHCLKRLEIIDGAGHLFEEPGTLHEVAWLAGNWFNTHLQPLKISGKEDHNIAA